jgi:hypothetical protein
MRFQLRRNEIQKGVNLVWVVTAFSDGRLGEGHAADLLGSDRPPRPISQRRLNAVKKRVNLVFVITALSGGRFRERNAMDLFRSKASFVLVH